MSRAELLPLPDYNHLPGKNNRPEDGMLESIAAKASATTTNANYRTNIAWHYGIRLYNAAYYWETHEVLEAVWNNAAPNSRERHLVQAVIQLANAQLKTQLGQHKAAMRLVTLASDCLTRAYPNSDNLSASHKTRRPGTLLGLDAEQMFLTVRQCRKGVFLQLNLVI